MRKFTPTPLTVLSPNDSIVNTNFRLFGQILANIKPIEVGSSGSTSLTPPSVIAGTGIGVVYDAVTNEYTISTPITQYTDERAEDVIATMIQNGTGISWVYVDGLGSGTLTPTVTLAPFTTTNLAEGANLYHTTARARAVITGTSNQIDYDSGTGVITISSTVLFPGYAQLKDNTPLYFGGTSTSDDKASIQYVEGESDSLYIVSDTDIKLEAVGDVRVISTLILSDGLSVLAGSVLVDSGDLTLTAGSLSVPSGSTTLGALTVTGNVTITGDDLLHSKSLPGTIVAHLLENTSVAASSGVRHRLKVASGAAGDPYTLYSVTGVTDWAIGIDNDDGDAIVISEGTSPGSNNRLKITSGGNWLFGQTTQRIAADTASPNNTKRLIISAGGADLGGGFIQMWGNNHSSSDAGGLDFECGSTGIMTFYTGGSERLRIEDDGVISITDGLIFGSGASNLNYYKTGSFTISWTTGWTASIDQTVNWTRIGNTITLTFGAFSGTSNSVLTGTAAGTIPAELCPTGSRVCVPVQGQYGGTYEAARMEILTTGVILFLPANGATAWPASGASRGVPCDSGASYQLV